VTARLFCIFLLLAPAWALDFGGGFQLKSANARPTLVADFATIKPGSEFTLGVSFEMDPGWHLYWRNYGDIGDAPKFDLTMPEGFVADAVLWPTPKRFESRSYVNFGYEKAVVYLIPITAPDPLPEGELAISVNAQWLVCNEGECVSDKKILNLTLQRGSEAIADAAGSALIAASRAQLPEVADFAVTAEKTDSQITLTLSGDALPSQAAVFPYARGLIDYKQAPDYEVGEGKLVIRLARPEAPPAEEPAEFAAVLVSEGRGLEISAPWGAPAPPQPVVKPMAPLWAGSF
jgi:DsbC/DsbD-like thiol-disulfide interchange protein